MDIEEQEISSSIHLDSFEDILKDRVSCEHYIKAIQHCPYLFEGKTVICLYSGFGFLTLLCCQAGAKHVYDIETHNDQSEEITRRVVADNKFSDRVTIIRGIIEDTKLPVEKVDIIVSMWQGYCLFYENKLEKLIWIRDKYLVEGGIMMPDWVSFKMALIEDEYYYDRKINFWDEVYNVNMSCIKDWVLTEPIVDLVDPSVVVTDTFKLLDFSLDHKKIEDIDFAYQYELTALESINAHAIVTWFELHFNLGPHENILSTSPYMPRTRLKQTIFYLKERLELKDGDRVHGSVAMKRVKGDKSSNFKISAHHKKSHITQFYTIN